MHEAEDLVQETFLRAWKASANFQGRSSVRTWLYRIATNVCLTNLEGRPRRPLPAGLGTPDQMAGDALEENHEIAWLEPVPDASVVVAERDSIRLAFVAALQHLPAKQRAVLILRDVLRWSAAEVAEALDTTVAAVNSALQRAHAQMNDRGLTEDTVDDGLDDGQRILLDQYVDAFWRKDIDAIVRLLKAEATWEMPPFTGWYLGNENIGRLIDTQCPGGINDMPMIETRANGQPAFGLYMRTKAGDFEPFHLQVLDIRDGKVAHVGAFFEPSLFTTFGLPARLPADYRPGDPVPPTPRSRAATTSPRARVVRGPAVSAAALDGAVELLDRSLAYTRVMLADVRPDNLDRPTPCAGWTLGRLLAHMEDALDAFTEAAAGRVEVDAGAADGHPRGGAAREGLRAARRLDRGPADARSGSTVGDLGLDAPLLVATAALEITVHGWDVGQATGRAHPDPRRPGRAACWRSPQHVIDPDDRGPRFAGPRPAPPEAGVRRRACSLLDRPCAGSHDWSTRGNRGERTARRGMAS